MVKEVEPTEVARQLKAEPEKVLLLNVREPFERDFAVILPSIHIPMNEISARAQELPRDRHVIVYCHSGSRSMMVAAFLEGHGFRSVANLSGGIDAWSVEVDPSVPRYG